ncbi:acyltransferase family protein [bacterium]|nr:acyltransferase family protein [bacterium]
MRKIDRLHYMDTLRAVAMFLGLVLHAGVVFAHWTIDDARQHVESSMALHYVLELIHVFRMELFFLVAGFFSLMLCRSKGTRAYVKNRIQRIVVPFILCVAFLLPWIAADFYLDQIHAREDFLSQYLSFFLDPSYIFTEPGPTGNWLWHFWFLHLLIYFITAFVLARFLWNRFKFGYRVSEKIITILKSRYALLVLVFITYPILLFSPPWTDVPGIGTSLDILIYYGHFFFLGALFLTDIKILDGFERQAKLHIIPCVIGLVILIPLIDKIRLSGQPEILLQNYSIFASTAANSALFGTVPLLQNPFNLSVLQAPFEWHLMCLLRAYTTWCGIIFFIVLFKKYFNKQSSLGRYAADASYFIYLIHFPIQLSMSYSLRDYVSSPILAFWICLIASILICLLLYHFTCRSTWLGRLLSGKTYSLNISAELQDLKSLLRSKRLMLGCLGVILLSIAADRVEMKKEKKLLYYSLCADVPRIKSYLQEKTPEQIRGIRRWDGRTPLHMVSSQLPNPPDTKQIQESIKILLQAGIAPDAIDQFGQTPLHYATRTGNQIAAQCLLDAGANPNARESKYGSTPLHYAATLGNLDLIETIVNAGGMPDTTRNDGKSPAQLLAQYHPNKSTAPIPAH